MARKTVDIATLVSRANGMLAAPSPTPAARTAISVLLEGILLDNDVYAGFEYVKPGGERIDHTEVAAGNYDESRRRYYVHVDIR